MTTLEIFVANSEHRGIVSQIVCQLGIFGVISSVRFKSMSCDEHAFDKYDVILSMGGGGGGGGGDFLSVLLHHWPAWHNTSTYGQLMGSCVYRTGHSVMTLC